MRARFKFTIDQLLNFCFLQYTYPYSLKYILLLQKILVLTYTK
jgi:hypothetical protein